MMNEKQKTIKKEFSLDGVGLHTGCKVHLDFKPADENTGINFIRVDLPQKPIVKAETKNISLNGGLPRCTSIGRDGAVIHTVEHLLSVLCGLGIDNLIVEINGIELPGLDGSALEYLAAIKKVGLKEQNAQKFFFDIKEPIGVQKNGSAIYAVPAEDFKISYTLDYDHPLLHSQYVSIHVNNKSFEQEIAPSRTFCLEKEAKELRSNGLGMGANYKNSLVVGEKGVIKNKLRFPDEFARHKVLDFMGDLYLLGMPIRGQIFAVKSGHHLNIALLKKICQQKEKYEDSSIPTGYDFGNKKEIDIDGIMKILPHRFPFLLVDRVIEIEKGKKAIGVKNVTINDPFFQGHFPTKPIMPGVLMIEAMAQTAGVMILTSEAHKGKLAFFMSTDKVKFRKVVQPGDQLLMEVEVIRDRDRTTQIFAQTKVKDEIVAEAHMVLSFTDASYLQ